MSEFFINRKIDKIDDITMSTPNGFTLFENRQVFFIDITNNLTYLDYINANLDGIRKDLSLQNRKFIHGNASFPPEILRYLFPYIPKKRIENNLNTYYFQNDADILEALNYKGFLQTGFLSIVNNSAVFVEKKSHESIEEYVKGYIAGIQPYPIPKVYFQMVSFDVDEDDETKKNVQQIKLLVDEIRQTKSDFYVMNILDKLYDEIKTENKLFKNENYSTLLIDEDYQIFLTEYDMEIKLPHLTKAIYFLFLKQEGGIDLRQLSNYKTQLLEIYKKVSYQTSYEKMVKSVEDLCKHPEKLYPHFSRIKSAYVSKFTNYYASAYYINGPKDDPKTVRISREFIKWKCDI